MRSIIQKLDSKKNELFIMREDLIPYSFGGNKARKAKYFFEEIDSLDIDTVVTYGSFSSNHARIIANMSSNRGLECIIISPSKESDKTYNTKMMKIFGASIVTSKVEDVESTIEKTLDNLRNNGKKTYFIEGGGHGNLGTKAYVDCFSEILSFELENNIKFDYIFLASGTGSTHSGLVYGKIYNKQDVEIIGISIARMNPRGRQVIIDSVKSFNQYNNTNFTEEEIEKNTIFLDEYIIDGYGSYDEEIKNNILFFMRNYGIPLDPTYTAKAYTGMKKYIEKKEIKDKKILFIHTGGTPLYFDFLNNI